jgi:type II secretory pathway pseudopilin PulG
MGLVDETRVTERKRDAVLSKAFSLAEVLVALAVLIVLGALVLPTLHGLSDTAEFRETCDQLSSAVSVCRSEAQRRGTPMELVTRKESDGRVALVGRPARLDESSKNPREENEGRGGQVLLVLPQGYSIDHESGPAEPSSESAAADAKASEPSVAAALLDEEIAARPLVVFWASGAASKGPGLYLHTRDGRVMGAEINSFTGALRLEQLTDSSDEKNAKPEGKTSRTGKTIGPMGVEPGGP